MRGLPIGCLTSQHFANFYLDRFDRFVKEELRFRGYVRYMDDMAIWAGDTASLMRVLDQSAGFLNDRLALQFKPNPYVNRTCHGMEFLGCRVFRDHLRLNRRSKIRFRRKMTGLENAYAAGMISESEMQERASALVAFTRTPALCSCRFRRQTLKSLAVSGQ